MLDNDLIRLDQKVHTVIQLRRTILEIERTDAYEQINQPGENKE
jgi:hypothetical protein